MAGALPPAAVSAFLRFSAAARAAFRRRAPALASALDGFEEGRLRREAREAAKTADEGAAAAVAKKRLAWEVAFEEAERAVRIAEAMALAARGDPVAMAEAPGRLVAADDAAREAYQAWEVFQVATEAAPAAASSATRRR